MNTQSTASIAIVDFGMGNLHSVARALAHVSPKSRHRDHRRPGRHPSRGPGGLSGAGRHARCHAQPGGRPGLAEAVREACGTKPTLGICLGEQMLLDESDEGADVHGAPTLGLGLVPGRVVRFDPARMKAAGNLKVPHMGWNRVHPTRPHPLWEGIEPGAFFYFVHSFHAEPTNPANVAATSVYGEVFTCAVTQNNMFATQFHPEKSAASGLRLFRNFIHWRP